VEGKRFLRTLWLRNFLSFGDDGVEVELLPLNVLIGPNGSGKSNLIEAISLLRAAPTDLAAPIREGGGLREWLWKGLPSTSVAQIHTTVWYPDGIMPLRYRIALATAGQRMEVVDEAIENERPSKQGETDSYFYYRYQNGHPALNVKTMEDEDGGELGKRVKRSLRREDLNPEQSVLSQRRDPDRYPEVTYVADRFGRIQVYREWNLGRKTPPRLPQPADLPGDFLLESAANLGLVLNDLEHRGTIKEALLEHLSRFYDAVEDLTTKIQGGTVQIFFHERGLQDPIPATRLSDGTLRYLSLLAILCHPSPPPLVCIEEPELGLHPDILPTIAELLLDASTRTQLIVTTHSDVLVSALSNVPEAVLVCERGESGTRMERLAPDSLQEWLKKYQLGELWRMGEIGGNRW